MTRLTVWHDGGCPLCRREIALMRRLDRGDCIEFIDANGAGTYPRDRAELLARSHAREEGRMLAGAARLRGDVARHPDPAPARARGGQLDRSRRTRACLWHLPSDAPCIAARGAPAGANTRVRVQSIRSVGRLTSKASVVDAHPGSD